jgi:alpha-amylase
MSSYLNNGSKGTKFGSRRLSNRMVQSFVYLSGETNNDMEFTPVDWAYGANLYEVNVRQYTAEGTFEAFGASLERLAEMGVEVLWFMPITPISVKLRQGTLGSYYACSDYKSTNPEFGSVQDFTELVNKAHDLGMKVIIDWVANHTGWDHIWTKTNPGFYKKNAQGEFYDTNNWHDVIDLNYYDHSMRRAMIEAMEFWVKECNIDGFRCDMAHLVPLDFWRDARKELDAYKRLFWLAETEDINYQQVFDCSYAWHWMHETEKFVKGEIKVFDLAANLRLYLSKTQTDRFHLFFTANHDENSWNGTEFEKYGGHADCLAVLSATWTGLPLIYSGQEIPNTKRLKFFDRDPIEWRMPLQREQFYTRLFRLRRTHPVFAKAAAAIQPVIIDELLGQGILAYRREFEGKELFVLLNLTQSDLALPGTVVASKKFKDVFTGELVDTGLSQPLQIAAYGYKLLVTS